MRADAAISLSVSAEWSREKDLMTASPLASPPMASRRTVFLAGMDAKSISVCEEMGSAGCSAAAYCAVLLDAAGRGGSASSRVASLIEHHFAMRTAGGAGGYTR